jgi:acyl carrier protein
VVDRTRTATAVHELLHARWPGRFDGLELHDELSLGEHGLGLDSIEIVEFLLTCEEELHGRSTEDLLTAGPVTLGRVVDHFATA